MPYVGIARTEAGKKSTRTRLAGSAAPGQPYTHEQVAEAFRRKGCQLVSLYMGCNASLTFVCRCGRTVTGTWQNFRAGAGGCRYCCRSFRGVSAKRRHSRVHLAWCNMHQRCYNPKCRKYPVYGARGIKVCERWRSSFAAFLEDMGDPPAGMTLDRIDVNGDYEPGNCRWATPKQQCRNKRNNRLLTAFGVTRTLAEWAEVNGIPDYRIQQRIDHEGWAVERAVSEPLHRQRNSK